MNLYREIKKMTLDCSDALNNKATTDMTLLAINIQPHKIDENQNFIKYINNVINYLIARGKLNEWLKELDKEGLAVAKKWLNFIKDCGNKNIDIISPIEADNNFVLSTIFITVINLVLVIILVTIGEKMAFFSENFETLAKPGQIFASLGLIICTTLAISIWWTLICDTKKLKFKMNEKALPFKVNFSILTFVLALLISID